MTDPSEDINSFDGWLVHLHEMNYPWSDDELRAMWDASGRTGTAFSRALAERKYNEAVGYYCAEGCCVVEWHEGFGGNIGGMGPVGCPCDDMDDPRGPNPRLIGASDD